ncbi:MAG: pyridoxal phosphate-dependent aminotransferase [Candidatus Eisenbacteria bacterium]
MSDTMTTHGKLAERMGRLGTETAFEVLARAKALERQGKEIIHLEIGEPDFGTPENIKEAAIKALRDGKTGYCPAPGIPELREALAADAGKRRGVDLKADRMVVFPGAKPVMTNLIFALVEEGDEVVYPNPGFPIYESMIKFVGAKPVPLPLREENEFRFDPEEMRSLVSDKTKLIILNSPANPTGGMLARSDLEAVAEMAKKHDAFVLSDEVYINIIYEGKHESILSIPGMMDRTILLDGLSKSYSMTGWRLGYGYFPEFLVEHVTRLNINSISCTSHFSQWGALEAVTGPQTAVEKMVAEFRKRRGVIVNGLNAIDGISCIMPKGAFYAFPNITGTGMKSQELERGLLDQAGVATLSGTSFGAYGQGFLRLSYANSVENIEKALGRIREFLKK